MILLKPDDYYTQRNNAISPNAACMPTARVMYYLANNIKYTNDSILADDDYFMELLNTENAVEYAQKHYPWSKQYHTPPNEIHGMYNNYLDQIVVGYKTSSFHTDLTWSKIVAELKQGHAIMTSGSMPTTSGHAFVIVGLEGGCLLLADPWGDYRTGYRRAQGYLVPMNEADFNKYVVRDNGKAWGHIPI